VENTAARAKRGTRRDRGRGGVRGGARGAKAPGLFAQAINRSTGKRLEEKARRCGVRHIQDRRLNDDPSKKLPLTLSPRSKINLPKEQDWPRTAQKGAFRRERQQKSNGGMGPKTNSCRRRTISAPCKKAPRWQKKKRGNGAVSCTSLRKSYKKKEGGITKKSRVIGRP